MPEEAQQPDTNAEDQSGTTPARRRRGLRILVVVLIVLVLLVVVVFVRESSVQARALEELRQAEKAAAAIEVPQVDPANNGADLYQQAIESVGDDEALPNKLIKELEAGLLEIGSEKITKLLDENKECLGLAMQGAAKPDCVFRVDYSLGFSAPIPNLVKVRAVAQMLALAARRAAHEGRPQEAAARIEAILKMSRGMGQMRFLISHMIGMLTERIALTVLREILTDGRGDTEFLTEMARVLAEHEKGRPRIAEALLIEEVCGRLGIARIIALRPPLGKGNAEYSTFGIQVRRWLGIPFRDAETCEGIWNQIRERAAKPYPQGYEEVRDLHEDPGTRAALKSLKFPYALWMMQGDLGTATDAEVLALLRGARAAVDICLQKGKDGKYPDAPPALPADPFTGKPLLYRKTAAGFVVYSVGRNRRKDDGGKNTYGRVRDPDVVFAVAPEARKAFMAAERKKLEERKKRPRPRLPRVRR
jgi:hypothetical protein